MSVVSRSSGTGSAVLQPVEPKSIKEALIEAGILPTPEQAKQTFWSLGEYWWMQIIDGMYHSHGKMVFDEGLHLGNIERGYLKGIEEGCRYFVDHLDGPLTLDLYRDTHHKACAHFRRGNNNGVCCDASEIDCFRMKRTTAVYPFSVKPFQEVVKTWNVFKEASRIIRQKNDGVRPALQKMMERQWKRIVVPAFELFHKVTDSQHVGKSEDELSELVIKKYEELKHTLKEAAAQLVDKMDERFMQIANRLGLYRK